MKQSLRRTLALRFAATMAAGLLLATGAFYWSASRALQESMTTATLRSDLLLVLAAIVVAGTAATLMGAWHFTSSAVRPVAGGDGCVSMHGKLAIGRDRTCGRGEVAPGPR